VPGTQPGELAPTRADYDRWLRETGAFGANVVRVYTPMRPHFYEALAAYDRAHRTNPIRLMQGVWSRRSASSPPSPPTRSRAFRQAARKRDSPGRLCAR